MTITYRSPVDIFACADHYEIHVDVPGATTDDVEIEVEQESLRVSAVVRKADGSEQARWERTFQLNKAVDRDRISAALEDGILRLMLPKPEETKPRRITVNAA